MIRRLPRLVCVQAARSAAIHHYVRTGTYRNAVRPETIADSISVSVPANAHLARKAVLESGGCSLTVTDAEILKAQRLLAEQAGCFAEPAAAAAAAALPKLRELRVLDRGAQVVLLLTGHGLKDVPAALRSVRMPKAVAPTLEAVEAMLETARRRGT